MARLPADQAAPSLEGLRDRLLSIGSEIWSAPAAPIQQAAAFAFGEPQELAGHLARSRQLHAAVARAVAGRLRAAGLTAPAPEAAYYLYPDFAPWRDRLAARHDVTTGAGLAALLLDRYGVGTLPASAFGEDPAALRLRLATGLLYGGTDEQRETTLAAADPLALPWLRSALTRIEDVLADLGGSALDRQQQRALGRHAVA